MEIIDKFSKNGFSKKKRNHFCKICVENRKLIFSYVKYQQIFQKWFLKKKKETIFVKFVLKTEN